MCTSSSLAAAIHPGPWPGLVWVTLFSSSRAFLISPISASVDTYSSNKGREQPRRRLDRHIYLGSTRSKYIDIDLYIDIDVYMQQPRLLDIANFGFGRHLQ